jgi:5-methylcytosine-specific restriction endonuclease McrA
VADRMSKWKRTFVCQCCGLEFSRRLFKTEVERGHEPRHCSWECRSKTLTKVRTEKALFKQWAVRNSRQERTKNRTQRRLEKQAAKLERHGAPCAVCGAPVGAPKRGQGKKRYCGKGCSAAAIAAMQKEWRRSPAGRESRAAARKKRKAQKRTATKGETISAAKVFEWAGWRCEACGTETPKELRGTLHWHAPELDHIIPLSRGGAHIRANVQLLCRKCNHEKADKMPTNAKGMTAKQAEKWIMARQAYPKSQKALF